MSKIGKAAFALCTLALALAPSGASAQAGDGLPPGGFLHDTTVIARVEDRAIRVHDFRDRYFSSDGNFRPAGDSTGRVDFLKSLVDREVMALAALAINRPLTFEDRHVLRGFEQSLLVGVFYEKAVNDSSRPTDEEIRRYSTQFDYQLHLYRIAFPDRETAERARLRLIGGRTSWAELAKRHDVSGLGPDGDMGWQTRFQFSGMLALEVFDLAPGGISPVLTDRVGNYYLYRAAGRRPGGAPSSMTVRRLVAEDIRDGKRYPLVDRMFSALRAQENVTYDSTQIRWVAERFGELTSSSNPKATLVINSRTLRLAPTDTGRVLARSRTRALSAGEFASWHASIPAPHRPPLNALALVIPALDRVILEPQFIQQARDRGLERDSVVVAEMARKREELLVQHLFEDSVQSRVSVTPEERRRYYQEHRETFVSRPRITYGRFLRRSEGGADSLVTALSAGAKLDSVQAADRAGNLRSSIEEKYDAPGLEFRAILTGELRPGEATRVGPDPDGNFLVLHLIDHTASRPMDLQEVDQIVDESVYNQKSEALLNALLARNRARYRIEAHPEWVMRVRLTDPYAERF